MAKRRSKTPLAYSVRTSGRKVVRTRSSARAAKLAANRARKGHSSTIKPIIAKRRHRKK